MGVLSLPRTLLMVLCWLIPVIVFFFANPILPLVFLLGISGPGYLNALLYRKSFERFEEKDDDTEEGSGEAGDEAVEEVSGEMTDQHMEERWNQKKANLTVVDFGRNTRHCSDGHALCLFFQDQERGHSEL